MATEIIDAPITGKIIQVRVKAGSKVKEGDTVCILESMKMENPILCPVSGIIKEIKVNPGQVVKAGVVIAVVEC